MSTFKDKVSNVLKIYPLNLEYIANINYQPADVTRPRSKLETVIILDRSGSMDVSVARIVNQIIPEFLRKLNYNDNDMIHLITFETEMEYFHIRVGDFASANIAKKDWTRMKSAITKFNEIFHNFYKSDVTSVRLLTISDGEIQDPIESKDEAQIVASFAKSTGILVNSHAIRWESRSADTTALCSLLQLNNVRPPRLLDIPQAMSNDDISTAWAELFMDDKLRMSATINQSKILFLKFPWDLEATNKIHLIPGENVFWLKEIPENVEIDGVKVKVDVAKTISYYELLSMLVENFELIASYLVTLKVVYTKETIEIITRILTYFSDVEVAVPPPNSSDTKKFSEILNEIATNDKVNSMDQTEKANYLREIQKSIADEIELQKTLVEEAKKRGEDAKLQASLYSQEAMFKIIQLIVGLLFFFYLVKKFLFDY